MDPTSKNLAAFKQCGKILTVVLVGAAVGAAIGVGADFIITKDLFSPIAMVGGAISGCVSAYMGIVDSREDYKDKQANKGFETLKSYGSATFSGFLAGGYALSAIKDIPCNGDSFIGSVFVSTALGYEIGKCAHRHFVQKKAPTEHPFNPI